MGEQRRGRGGRGRSGRGGRIPPRRGEQGGALALGEEFSSFPMEMTEPIRVDAPLSAEAVAVGLRATLGHEGAQLAALTPLAETGGPVMARVRLEVERHQALLEQLAGDLGVDTTGVEPGGSDALTSQRLAQTGWLALQRAGYAFGDKRIDHVVRPVLIEKARHAEVIEGAALVAATQAFVREMEE